MYSDENQFLNSLYSEISLLQNDGSIIDIMKAINYEKHIKNLDPLSSSLFFSGLFLNKHFYSNSFRLEFIILSILSRSDGNTTLDIRLAKKAFESINGSMVQKYEDPAEEVMISTVNFLSTTFKLLEGTWVNNAFYLQRLLDCMEHTPDIEPFQDLKNSITTLLNISDNIINKTELEEYSIGEKIPRKSFVTGSSFKDLDKTHILEIDTNKIQNIDFLVPFVFDYDLRKTLSDQSINHNELHKKPIVKYEGNYYLLFPNSIGIALKNYIISFCKLNNVLDVLEQQYKQYYLHFFREDVRILGDIARCPQFKIDMNQDYISQSIIEVNPGLFIHLIYIFDNFKGVLENGFNNTNHHEDNTKKLITNNISKVVASAKNNKNFKRGISLLISCGYGRSCSIPTIKDTFENWFIDNISAPDLVLLSNVSQLNSLKFFRFLEGKKKLQSVGVDIFNYNGLLNLYAWTKNNKYQFMPDEVFPGDMSDINQKININIDPTSILDIRQEVYSSTDVKYIKNPYEKDIKIYKMGHTSLYKEDFNKPLYASLTDLKNQELVGILNLKNIKFWVISDNNSNYKSLTYNIWQGLCYRAYDVIITIKEYLDFDLNHIEWKYYFLDDDIPNTVNIAPPLCQHRCRLVL